jgi:small multidrug resistance family-3 protein
LRDTDSVWGYTDTSTSDFGRVYAAYGGVFVVLSIVWGWGVDKITPDKFDVIGGAVALAGVFIIMYWPRSI